MSEVFRWLSVQNLHHKYVLVQLFLPSFSTTHPTLIIADLDVIGEIVTKRIKGQRRLWNVVLNPKFLTNIPGECFFDAATELADLWIKKATLAGSARAFDAEEDVKMATLDGMWKMYTGTDLGLSTARTRGLQERSPIKREIVDKLEFTKS